MALTAEKAASTGRPEGGSAIPLSMQDVPTCLIGEAGAWLRLERDEQSVELHPVSPMPRRCTIRPAALFENQRGFVEVNIVMGRLVFFNGSDQSQTYRPFTRDPKRKLRELFFPIETMPEDDFIGSTRRWANYQAIAKRLLASANVPWPGLERADVQTLVDFVAWPEPLDGCLLHALAQWTHDRGDRVIEIGSYRGASLTMLAMALRAVGSESSLISIDPHETQPHNHQHVQLALRQINEEGRLVQIQKRSDDASRILSRQAASLIYIDGCHSFEQVVADFENYIDLLAPGGCMLFHDYGCGDHNGIPETHPGVRKALDSHVLGSSCLQPLLLAHTLFAFVKQ